jgi:hypothetical protein
MSKHLHPFTILKNILPKVIYAKADLYIQLQYIVEIILKGKSNFRKF